MIADAHPVRSGVPDCYVARLRVNVVVLNSNWTLDTDRLPSGFSADGALTGAAGQTNVRNGVGIGGLLIPAGMRVRGVQTNYTNPTLAAASFREVQVAALNETTGRLQFQVLNAAGAQTDPVAPTSTTSNDSCIWIDITLETI